MKFILFADDTCLQYSFEPNAKIESVLNNELEKVTDWLITNRLSLNVDKSNYLIFSLHNKRDKYNITMNNDKLQEKDYTKYLDIIIDRKLNWKQHVSQTKLRLSKGIGILYRLRSYVTKSTLISLYFDFIQSNKLLFIKLGKCTSIKPKVNHYKSEQSSSSYMLQRQ